jgi:hypothetical protein
LEPLSATAAKKSLGAKSRISGRLEMSLNSTSYYVATGSAIPIIIIRKSGHSLLKLIELKRLAMSH